MILLYGQSLSFAPTLPGMATGGKAYRYRSSQSRLSASTVKVRESETGNTKLRQLLVESCCE